ncbi:MAG: ATP-binding cassette domain-containing protein, partial [Limnochordales bacterium]|nr:ATP-binding cassette domain-containing protein [Limnochordales bacterium]
DAYRALSAGQRQRLAIARALLRRPRLLLVDEPTSSIDQESKEALMRTLVQRKGQSTIVLVTHDPDLVRIADWVVVLDSGKVVWQGPSGKHGAEKAAAAANWS